MELKNKFRHIPDFPKEGIDFIDITTVLNDSEAYPLSVFLSRINTEDTGIAFAAATVYMIVPMLMFLYSEDYLVDGISYSGGIK